MTASGTEVPDPADVRLRQGAWKVLHRAYRNGHADPGLHGKGFVTEAVNAGCVVREPDGRITLTDLGRQAAEGAFGTRS